MTTPAATAWIGSPEIWRLLIVHRTVLTYPDTVTTSYNEVRMQPNDEPGQAVLSARLEIDPFEGVLSYVDYFGTRVAAFDVLAAHRSLAITARSLVEVRPRPIEHRQISWEELAAETERSIHTVEQLGQTARTAPHPEVVQLAREIAASHDEPGPAAHAIAIAIGDAVEYMTGVTGVHSTAAESWPERKGVCQDIAHITLGALRSVGIPARYVSGYLHPDPDAQVGAPVTGESHAWIEWFAGDWQGFDPTNNVEISDRHVLVGRGRDYNDVPPLRGVFAGPYKSALHVTVTITREA